MRLLAGQRAAPVRLLVDHPRERTALGPSGLRQLGLVRELVDVADAQVRDDFEVFRQAELADHLALVEEADPAHAEALGARGEPEVLDREGGGVRGHLRLGVPAEGVAAAAGGVGGDDDVHRGVEDGLDLEFLELLRPALGQRLGVGLALALGELVHRPPGLGGADDDEVPGLRVADAGRVVGGLQDAQQHLVRDGVGTEAVADVAALAHDAQHGLALGVVVPGGGLAHGDGFRGLRDLGGVGGLGGVRGVGVRGAGLGGGLGDRLGGRGRCGLSLGRCGGQVLGLRLRVGGRGRLDGSLNRFCGGLRDGLGGRGLHGLREHRLGLGGRLGRLGGGFGGHRLGGDLHGGRRLGGLGNLRSRLLRGGGGLGGLRGGFRGRLGGDGHGGGHGGRLGGLGGGLGSLGDGHGGGLRGLGGGLGGGLGLRLRHGLRGRLDGSGGRGGSGGRYGLGRPRRPGLRRDLGGLRGLLRGVQVLGARGRRTGLLRRHGGGVLRHRRTGGVGHGHGRGHGDRLGNGDGDRLGDGGGRGHRLGGGLLRQGLRRLLGDGLRRRYGDLLGDGHGGRSGHGGRCRSGGGTPVREGTHDSPGFGHGRAHVQRAASGDHGRRGRHLGGLRGHEAAEVQRAGVTAAGLVRARAVRGGLRVGVGEARARGVRGVGEAGLRGLLRRRVAGVREARLREAEVSGLGVAGRGGLRVLGVDGLGREGRHLRDHLGVAPGTLAARHQQQFLVLPLGGVVHEVLEGVARRGLRRKRREGRNRSGNALLIHHAPAVRVTLARDLAGVSHAYPSPIGVAS